MKYIFNLKVLNKILNDYKYMFYYYFGLFSAGIILFTIYLRKIIKIIKYKNYLPFPIIISTIFIILALILIFKFLKLIYYINNTYFSFLRFNNNFGHLICFCGEPGCGKTRTAVYYSNLIASYNYNLINFEKWLIAVKDSNNIDIKANKEELSEAYIFSQENTTKTPFLFSNIKIYSRLHKSEIRSAKKEEYKRYFFDNKYYYKSAKILEKIKIIKNLNKELNEKYKKKEIKTISNLLSTEHLVQLKRLPYRACCVFDEVGAYLSLELSKSPIKELEDFFRYIRHYIEGKIILTEQDSSHIPICIRRVASSNIQVFKTKKVCKSLLFNFLEIISEYIYDYYKFSENIKIKNLVYKINKISSRIGVLKSRAINFSSDTSFNKISKKFTLSMPCNNLVQYDTRGFSNAYLCINKPIYNYNYKNENSLKSESIEYLKKEKKNK